MSLRHRLAIVGVVLVSVAAWSQDAVASGAKHDLNGQKCTACHVPRPSPPETQPENTCDKTLLWDCDLLTRTFDTYEAPLPTGNPKSPVLDETQLRMSSMLCASCHDGVSTPTMSGAASFRSRSATTAAKSLQNEHPIDVSHDPVKDTSLAALDVVTHQVKLFGQTNRVQCATCHDVHDSSDSKLLRTPNKNSSLCLACHL
jgi:predicted CXXCH cytochrome family protein